MLRSTIVLTALFLPISAAVSQADENFQLQVGEDRFVATGMLVASSGAHIDATRAKSPDTKLLVMEYVPGSDDENDYLEAAWKLRQAGFATVVPANGLIASGGTDFFLAGVKRIIEPGACIGVHSWEDSGPPPYSARSLPRDHEDHEDYLEYFAAIGIPSDFYWFTIYAAPANGMHWMSPAEINRFGMSTVPLPEDDGESDAERAYRCDERTH